MFKKYIFIFFIALCLPKLNYGQSPCLNGFVTHTINGTTTSYPCNDYELMSRVPISVLANTQGTPEGSDIWGWTDTLTGKEYAIIGTTNSTAFVDISTPESPIFLGRIDTSAGTNFWRDVKVYNNHAFIVADNVGTHGMQIFDLTRLRSGVDPDFTYTADTTFNGDNGITINSCHNIVINESEGIAYLVGCGGAASGGPVFVDISNPTSPTVLGSYADKGYTHDAQVITYNGPDTDAGNTGTSSYVGREILVASNGASGGGTDKVVFIDVTDKTNPQFISETTYPQAGYAHQGWFTDDHKYFIFGDEQDEQFFGGNTKTLVFNVEDLDNPVLSSTYTSTFDAIDHNGYVNGNNFYLANYRAGMRVLDITNISAPTNSMTEVGYFDTYPANDNTNFNGAWSIYPYFSSGNIIISDIERGLFVVRKTNVLNIEEFELNTNFSIYPNPTSSTSTIKAPNGNQIKSIKIFDILGKKTFENNNINKETFVLPTQSYSKGIYLIQINNSITKRLIIN